MTRSRDGGFTLIELIVVLAVLGLMAGLVVSRGPLRSPGLEARAAVGELAGGLRLARAEAIARDRPVPFALDVDAHAYRVGDAPPRALPPAVALRLLTTAGQAGGGVGRIVFAPDGSATGGWIELAGAGRRWRIGVDWITGGVTVADAR